MDSKQSTIILTDNTLFVQHEKVELKQKSNLRRQMDDLLFGSVI